MATDAIQALSILRTMTAALGAFIVVYATRAWWRTRSTTLFWFTAGIAVVTGGFLLEGALFQFFGWPLERASAMEAILTLAAFGMLVASLLVRDSRRVRAQPTPPSTRDAPVVPEV